MISSDKLDEIGYLLTNNLEFKELIKLQKQIDKYLDRCMRYNEASRLMLVYNKFVK